MPDITVTVGGTPSKPTYSGNKVASDGKIEVEPGTTTIQFRKADDVRWTFKNPAITFDDSNPFTVQSSDGDQVTISDEDPLGNHPTQTYEYTLKTSVGDYDPQILNKGKL